MFLRRAVIIAMLFVLSVAEGMDWRRILEEVGVGRRLRKREEYASINECAYAYEGVDHFDRFTKWTNAKNSSHYSPIHPAFQSAIRHLDLKFIKHGLPVTSGGDNCKFKHLDKVRNSAEVPLRDRALCSFEFVLNYNAKRMPAAITEVKCTCSRPSPRVIGNHLYECEPLLYEQRVLLFDEDCQQYVPTVQTFVYGCIPVAQRWKSGNGNAEVAINPLMTEVEY